LGGAHGDSIVSLALTPDGSQLITGGKDAALKHTTAISDAGHNSADYDLVVIGTPVWAGTLAPAVRTWIAREKESLPNIAVFLTTGGSGIDNTLSEMAALCARPARAKLGLKTREVKRGEHEAKVRAFVEALAGSGADA